MKKTLILLVFLLFTILAFGQHYSESKVLNKFYIGFDTEKNVKKDLNYDELQEYNFSDVDNLKLIRLNGYIYKNQSCDIVMLFVNDILYGIQYYPKKDNRILNYISNLNKNYKIEIGWKNPLSEVVWSNNSLIIYKEMTANYEEYFIHYNKDMLLKYPKYKNF